MGKLDTVEVNGPEGEVLDWDAVDWHRVEDDVRRLRQRIFTRACLSRLPGKRARPVLRGPRRGDASGLPDYWAVDVLQAAGATVHLAHPLGVKGFRYRRVKNDVRDAADLADLLRMGRLPEAWIAPPETRELRELVRYRAKLVAIRSGLKAQVHAVLAKAGVLIAVSDLFGVTGRQRLAKVPLGPAYAATHPLAAGTHRHPRRPRSALRRDDRRTAGRPTAAITRSSTCPASGRCWRRCSSPRSGTCTASPAPRTCARGPV